MPAGSEPPPRGRALSRRRLLGAAAAGGGLALADQLGLGAAAAGAAETATGLDRAAVAAAERIQGVAFTDAQRDQLLPDLDEQLGQIAAARGVPLDNAVAPAFHFDPQPFATGDWQVHLVPAPPRPAIPPPPASEEEIAFAPIDRLAGWLAGGQLTSTGLTRLCLDRLRRHDPLLRCVVTLTEERALEAARRADAELAAGRWRGLLHGIPWGAKDLIAVPGQPTTWGTPPYRDQVRPELATVVRRLDEAGAVLVAKLAVGELAWGDVWFGGQTRNPWKPEQGSSGSSAGSAAAVAAGLVPFALGTETWGSIVSPARRCGVTGLRPTYGRISRHGVMALAWTFDKVGVLARSARSCAWILAALAGADPLDPSAVDRDFDPDPRLPVAGLRVGVAEALFAGDYRAGDEESRALDRAMLDRLAALDVELVPFALPELPIEPLAALIGAEAGAAFDELTLSGGVEAMVRQTRDAWPNVFRAARFLPAVDYLRMQRIRTLLVRDHERRMADLRLDAYVAPALGVDLLLTNLTGHPAVLVRNGFRADGTPSGITLTGRLYGESRLLLLAEALEAAAGFRDRRPALPDPASSGAAAPPE
jgi:Asp-tRNA(Asn)/Glu-tRNA(Gln) amidotransferase A subunit family amidase